MINLKDFRKHYKDAIETESEELFIAEPGWEDWMDRYDVDTAVSILKIIYKLSQAGHNITKLRTIYGSSRSEFSRTFGIPLRTLENWDNGICKPNDYPFYMIAHEVFIDMCLGELSNAE